MADTCTPSRPCTVCDEPAESVVRYGMTAPHTNHEEPLCRTHTMELWGRYSPLCSAGLGHWTHLEALG